MHNQIRQSLREWHYRLAKLWAMEAAQSNLTDKPAFPSAADYDDRTNTQVWGIWLH